MMEWWERGRVVWVGAALVPLVLISALGVIYSSHQSRQLFHELEQTRRESRALEEDWERLLLEQSTWAAHERIRQLAEEKLDMTVPELTAMKVIHER